MRQDLLWKAIVLPYSSGCLACATLVEESVPLLRHVRVALGYNVGVRVCVLACAVVRTLCPWKVSSVQVD